MEVPQGMQVREVALQPASGETSEMSRAAVGRRAGKQVKILFVDNAGLVGGAEEHLMDLASHLRERGVLPVFVAREEGRFWPALEERGFRCYPSSREWPRKAVSLFQLAGAIRREEPDVISVNREHDLLPAFLAREMARPVLRKTPRLVAVIHIPAGKRRPVAAFYDGIVATSRYTADAFCRANPSVRKRTRVLHCGISIPVVEPAAKLRRDRPRRIFPDRGFPIIGMVGEFWKNQAELVDAARHMVREMPELTVVFAGGGFPAQIEGVRERIRSYGLEGNFILTGRLPRARMADLFYDLDLSVTTHRNEGFGIVHIESLASLTPVVAYNQGGYVEILQGGGGMLVDGGVEEFARAVVSLLRDDARRFRLAREGRQVVEGKFSLERMGEEHLAYYRGILGESREE